MDVATLDPSSVVLVLEELNTVSLKQQVNCAPTLSSRFRHKSIVNQPFRQRIPPPVNMLGTLFHWLRNLTRRKHTEQPITECIPLYDLPVLLVDQIVLKMHFKAQDALAQTCTFGLQLFEALAVRRLFFETGTSVRSTTLLYHRKMEELRIVLIVSEERRREGHSVDYRTGDQLISINGKQVDKLTKDEVHSIWGRKEPKRFEILRRNRSYERHLATRERLFRQKLNSAPIHIVLKRKRGRRMGLLLLRRRLSDYESLYFVARIERASVAEREGSLREGDQLIVINGHRTDSLDPDEVDDILDKCKTITLTVYR